MDRAALGQRAAREFKELLALAAYLYVSLGAVVLLKSAILQDAGISFPIGASRPQRPSFWPSPCFSRVHSTWASDIGISRSSGRRCIAR